MRNEARSAPEWSHCLLRKSCRHGTGRTGSHRSHV